MDVLTGLDHLIHTPQLQASLKGQIGLLCNSASVDRHLELGVLKLKKIFGKRLSKLFGPQHGFHSDLQYNMEETPHAYHSYLDVQIYSLYSETRQPTDAMLEGIQTLLVDLQDVGTRVYTYIYTLGLLMEKCQGKDIEVVVLDRVNPVGGTVVEGTILKSDFKSFVGLYALPHRHALTIGEVAQMGKRFWNLNCNLRVIPLKNWKRSQSFMDTKLPWVLPSPSLATPESSYTFVTTVLFEGTLLSEGRGTTKAMEVFGHPKLEPFRFLDHWQAVLSEEKKKCAQLSSGNEFNLEGFILRPMTFVPTFNKHKGLPCGGFQIHITDPQKVRPWLLGQLLLRELYSFMGKDFVWNKEPYEYEHKLWAIDLINGTDELRKWVEKRGNLADLYTLTQVGRQDYLKDRAEILIYP